MAKKSSIERNLKRQKLTAKFAAKKAELKKVLKDPNTSDEEFFAAQRKLCKLPRNASKVRIRNRCSITGSLSTANCPASQKHRGNAKGKLIWQLTTVLATF